MANVATPEQRSTPDLQKINGMTSRTLMVTQFTSKGSAGRHIATERNVDPEHILRLPAELVAKFGPGTYRFEVADEGGPDNVVWTQKLGPDTPEATFNGGGAVGGWSGADGVDSEQVAPGWWYNERLGAIISPTGKLTKWRPGEPLPSSALTAMAGGASGAPSTPWGAPPAPSYMPGGDDPRVRALEEQIREQREQRKEEARARELTELRDSFAKALSDITAKLTEKKADGPSEEVLELRRQMTEMKAAQDARAREDALRAEMRSLEERSESRFQALVRELKDANKAPDPMMPLLMQLLSTQQNASAEAVKAIRDAASSQAEGMKSYMGMIVERMGSGQLTPERFLEMIRTITSTTKGANDEINKAHVDMFKTLFGMSRDVLEMQKEFGGNDGPAWLPIAQQAVEQVGKVAAVAAASAAARPVAPAVAPVARAPAPRAPRRTLVTAPEGPKVLTSAEVRDQAAKRVFDRPETTSSATRDELAGQVFKKKGARPDEAAPAAPAVRPRKRRPQPGAAAVPAPAPAQAVLTPDQLAQIPAENMRVLVSGFDDAAFFGSAVTFVNDLREQVAAGMPPAQAAQKSLLARPMLQGAGEYPPVLEMFDAGHFLIIAERLLPETPIEYQALTASALAIAAASENEGVAGDDDEGEEEDDDAAA